MLYINEDRILSALDCAVSADGARVDAILSKSASLQRLSLEETAELLGARDEVSLNKIFSAARSVKEKIYGSRVVIFAPLYISNHCVNNCLYCAFRSGNLSIERKALSAEEIKEQTENILKKGHKRVLVVAGEAPPPGKENIDYYIEAVEAVYSAGYKGHYVRRANINCAPLSVEDFKRLKASGIGTYQIFQETYHERTYRRVHPSGPKSDPDNRIDAVNRAFTSGIDDVGIGVLYGLYDYRFETLAMLMHVEELEKKFGVGPHTISVPRIEPAAGSDLSVNIPYRTSDEDFKKIVAVLRLSVPYTGIILTTRESPELRDELFSLGISQVSAASSTAPGGYGDKSAACDGQFEVGDHRSLDEVLGTLIKKGHMPSFCAACYRKERTGGKFMDLAKPGTIKNMCQMNALITLKEYLDDFASKDVKNAGYALIEKEKLSLKGAEAEALKGFFRQIEDGVRDRYV